MRKLLVCLLLAWVPSLFGATYYCDIATGADGAAGDAEHPFKNIKPAITAAAAAAGNHTINIAPGNYPESDGGDNKLEIPAGCNTKTLTFQRLGEGTVSLTTSDTGYVVGASALTTGGLVFTNIAFNPTNASSLTYSIVYVGAKDVNLTFTGCSATAAGGSKYGWVRSDAGAGLTRAFLFDACTCSLPNDTEILRLTDVAALTVRNGCSFTSASATLPHIQVISTNVNCAATVTGSTFTGGNGGLLMYSAAATTNSAVVTDNTFDSRSYLVRTGSTADNSKLSMLTCTGNAAIGLGGICYLPGATVKAYVANNTANIATASTATRVFSFGTDPCDSSGNPLAVVPIVDGVICENNSCTYAGATDCHAYFFGGDLKYSVIRNNTAAMTGTAGKGLVLKGAKYNRVYGNRLYGKDPLWMSADSIGNHIHNNTSVATTGTAFNIINLGAGVYVPNHNEITDNILVSKDPTDWAIVLPTTDQSNIVNHNLYYCDGGKLAKFLDADLDGTKGIADMQAAWTSGWTSNDADSLVADPGLLSTDPANANFLKIGFGSPAMGAASISGMAVGAHQIRAKAAAPGKRGGKQ